MLLLQGRLGVGHGNGALCCVEALRLNPRPVLNFACRSNAGFIAFGTMLHLVSLLSSRIAAPAASGESPRLVFDPTQVCWDGGATVPGDRRTLMHQHACVRCCLLRRSAPAALGRIAVEA